MRFDLVPCFGSLTIRSPRICMYSCDVLWSILTDNSSEDVDAALSHPYSGFQQELAQFPGGDGYRGAWDTPEPTSDAELVALPDGFAAHTQVQSKSAVDFIVAGLQKMTIVKAFDNARFFDLYVDLLTRPVPVNLP
jgi:hypothetical protein